MLPDSDKNEILNRVTFPVGDAGWYDAALHAPAVVPFHEETKDFLEELSRRLRAHPDSRNYPDVVTYAFWIRRASLQELEASWEKRCAGGGLRLGRGVAFHIAPSNVPVNFAYSLTAGLLSGNCNVVRVPSKEFPQVTLIADAINETLASHASMRPRILLVRYERDRSINSLFSAGADVRVVWGGDGTIGELRQSPLPPRSIEITFADRYSLAVIDSDTYLGTEDRAAVAQGFYNDTYLTDQNACTSPKLVVWTGKRREEAKRLFWEELYGIVKARYPWQDIQGVNKLVNGCLLAARTEGVRITGHGDNLLVRASVPRLHRSLFDDKANSGFFMEYDCDDVMELREICNDKRCQTVAMLGDRTWLRPLFDSGIRGIDRVTDIGKTMDFSLTWDGYRLIDEMSREISI